MTNSSKIKICIISTYSYPLFNLACKAIHGGAEVQFYLISSELARDSQFEVSIIVGDFQQNEIEYFNQVKLIKSINPTDNQNFVTKFIQAFKYVSILKKEKPDIVFTQGANSTIGLVALFCKLFKKKHLHLTASDIDVNFTWIKRYKFLGKIYKYGLENAHQLLVQSEYQKVNLEKNHHRKGLIFSNVFLFPNIINSIPREFILWVGRIDYMKKPGLFFNLANYFQNEQFVIICPINPSFKNEWEDLRTRSQTIQNMKFIPHVPFNEIQEYFNKAIVFINTSDFEGYPNTFVQAGIGATPIISLIVDPDNFLTKNDCGYSCDGNFERMVENLGSVLKDKENWLAKSRNIFSYMSKKHDIAQNINKLKEILVGLKNGEK